MHKLNQLSFTNVWQFCCDFVLLLVSFFLSYLITAGSVMLNPVEDYIWVLVVYIPFWAFSMGFMGMYKKTTFNYYDRIIRNVILSTMVAGSAVAVLFYLMRFVYFSRSFLTVLILLTIALLVTERYIFLSIFRRKREFSSNRVLVIGTQELIQKFEYYLDKTQVSMNIIGYMKLDRDSVSRNESRDSLESLPHSLKEDVVDEIILAVPRNYLSTIEKYIFLCEEMGITVRLLVDLFDLKVAKTNLHCIGPIPMLTYHTVSLNDVQLFVKRFMDIIGSIIGIIITAFLSILIIPMIKFDSPGPVFFCQDRVGLRGRIFKLYKFRSMYVDAEDRKKELIERNEIKDGRMFKLKDDPRITRSGKILRKLSLDELPQFWNVLKGDMSLVGTRPPMPDEVSKYLNDHWRRISIKPGLTGLWQVSGRSSILDFDEVVKLDTCYIDQWSITEDLKIIIKTIPAVIAKRGAM